MPFKVISMIPFAILVCFQVEYAIINMSFKFIYQKDFKQFKTNSNIFKIMSFLLRLDHILLETTGLANPAPLASILWLDDQLEAAVKLDSIITVS